MSIINYTLFFFFVGFLMIGSQLAQVDMENNVERDIYNFTESTIKLNPINFSIAPDYEITKGIINVGRLNTIVDSLVDFLLISTEQITKMGIEYGYEHPNINFKIIWKYLIYILIIIIIVLLIKPIGYIIIFIIMLGIMIKEKRDKRNKIKMKRKK